MSLFIEARLSPLTPVCLPPFKENTPAKVMQVVVTTYS